MKWLFVPIKFLFQNKLKILIIFVLTLLFFILFFPMNDLRELITNKVYQVSGNRIIIFFDSFELNFFPPGIKFYEFRFSSPEVKKTITAQEISIIPSYEFWFKRSLSGEIKIKNIWGGILFASIKRGSLTENGIRLQKIHFSSEKISLAHIFETLGSKFKMNGLAQLTVSGEFEPHFNTQPDFDIEINLDQWTIPSTQIQTPLGPQNIPSLNLGKGQIKGRWSLGKFNIETLKVNSPDQMINGTIKGYLSLPMSSGYQINPGPYQLDINLTLLDSIPSEINQFLILVDHYKSLVPGGRQYKIRINGQNFYEFPQISSSL